jgi:trimeric autotransporter adhesin
MVRSFRFSNASLIMILALGLITLSCGGSYSAPSGGQTKSLTDVSLYAQLAPSIPVNGNLKLIAYGTYGDPAGANPYSKDVSSTATWTSSDEFVATVTMGQVIGTGIGSVAITAKLGGHSGVTTVVVGLTPDIAITPDGTGTFSLSQPQQQFFANATYSDSTVLDLTNYVMWSSTPTGIMKFDDPYGMQPGLATFTSTGTATITATLKPGEEGSLTVTVGP